MKVPKLVKDTWKDAVFAFLAIFFIICTIEVLIFAGGNPWPQLEMYLDLLDLGNTIALFQ